MADRDTPDGANPGDDDNLADDNLADPDDSTDGQRERLEAAERRGVGRGTFIGLGIAVLLILIIAAVLFWWNPFAPSPEPDNTVPVTSLPNPSIAPTESLPVSTATVAPPAPSPTDTSTAQPAPTSTEGTGGTLALNRWNWIPGQEMFSVAGFIEGTEEGGTCTLTAASGGITLVANAPATADVTTTICVVNLQSPEVTAGDWQLTMSYDGPSGAASSDTVSVTVPE